MQKRKGEANMLNFLTTASLSEDARKIREEVFMKEQGFEQEFDETDNRASCMTVYNDAEPVACCRYFRGGRDGEIVLGRLAVKQEYRGRHIGEKIIKEVEKEAKMVGARFISLSAQVQAVNFYKKQGFQEKGEIYYEEYCEHIHMEKVIK